ncbi:MAG: dTDP-4-dehydrorhamnose reductase [Acidimicrobiia bacterium]|nr:dTDP-4-dehydrorhamnose reductase [Acidimicrobiia bacterium]
MVVATPPALTRRHPMNVLVTGASGQLGLDVVQACREAGDDVAALGRDALDVTDRDQVRAAITSVRPDVVVHCAAWTAVDACESDPDRAYAANGLAVRWVAESCRATGAHLVHVSTDYVFSGTKAEPYQEWDIPDPRSVYGASKLMGEREAIEAGIGAAVVRLSWVCGAHGSNMVKTILRLAGEHEQLTFVDDQRGHPTFTADAAPLLRRLGLERRSGVHHVTNQGAVSWFEFASRVMELAGLDPARVRPVPTAALQPPRPAPRPANSVLDNAVLRASGIPLLDPFEVPLERVIMRLLKA